jgi:hypothetical protein
MCLLKFDGFKVEIHCQLVNKQSVPFKRPPRDKEDYIRQDCGKNVLEERYAKTKRDMAVQNATWWWVANLLRYMLVIMHNLKKTI